MATIWGSTNSAPVATDRVPKDVSSSGGANHSTMQQFADLENLVGKTVNALGSIGTNTTIDLSLGGVVTATITGSLTFSFSNVPTAASWWMVITNGGSATITWPGTVSWTGGTAPTLQASGTDVLRIYRAGGVDYVELASDEVTTPAGSSNELQRNSGGTFAGATGVTWDSNQLLITAQAAGTCPAAIKLATSHTANGLEIQNSAGTVLALTDSAGVSRAASFRHITTANQAGLTFVSGYAQLIGYNGAVCLSIPLSGTGANAQDRLSLGPNYYTTDAGLNRVAAGIIGIRGDSSSAGAAVSLIEQTAPSAPATNGVYIYAEDDGAGKTRLMALFATGAAQQIAIEP